MKIRYLSAFSVLLVWQSALAQELEPCGPEVPCYGLPCQCTYDSNGNRLTEEHFSSDGTQTYRVTFTYDANSQRLTRSLDLHGDGTIDRTVTFTHDPDGNLLTEEGDPWVTISHTYSPDGDRLTKERDYNHDGTTDELCTYDPPCPPEVHRDPDEDCPVWENDCEFLADWVEEHVRQVNE